MRHRVLAARWAVPVGAVLACTAAAVLLTGGLGPGTSPPTASPVANVAAQASAAGSLEDLLPNDTEWGTGWVRDDEAAWQQIADGPGLLHPCGATYASDSRRLEFLRRNVAQDEQEVPVGSAMTYELARYVSGGAVQALAERLDSLQGCATYRTTFAGLPDTPIDIALLSPPAGGESAAAHLAVTADTSVGRQAVEYTYLVARQGDVLLTALVGNGNGNGPDLDAFARGYFQTARQKLAGLPHPSPELQYADAPGSTADGAS